MTIFFFRGAAVAVGRRRALHSLRGAQPLVLSRPRKEEENHSCCSEAFPQHLLEGSQWPPQSLSTYHPLPSALSNDYVLTVIFKNVNSILEMQMFFY